MSKRPYNWKPLHERTWNGRVSAEYGCTVTFENAAGQTLVWSRKGRAEEVLRDMCLEAVALDPTFRVVSYSNPETIRHDLRGRFSSDQPTHRAAMHSTPEGRMLARIGMTALLHPRLVGKSPDAEAGHAKAIGAWEASHGGGVV